MIHVDPRPEPADFDQKVRKRGNHWLASHAQGEWKEYWRDCLDDLYCCYDGVCAYLGLRPKYSIIMAGDNIIGESISASRKSLSPVKRTST